MTRFKITLDRIEGSYALFSGTGGESLKIPRSRLPKFKKGEVFSIEIKTGKEAELGEKELAKAILNQILDISRQ